MLWSGWIWGLYKVSACSVGRPPLCSKVCTVVQKGRWLPFIESTIFHVLCTHTIYFQTFLGKVQHKNTKYGGEKGHLLHYYSSSTFHIQINEMVKPKLHEIISATRCLPRVLSLLLFIICIWWGLISCVVFPMKYDNDICSMTFIASGSSASAYLEQIWPERKIWRYWQDRRQE